MDIRNFFTCRYIHVPPKIEKVLSYFQIYFFLIFWQREWIPLVLENIFPGSENKLHLHNVENQVTP